MRSLLTTAAVAAALVLVSAPGWLPLLDPRFYRSHDGFEHAFRILSIESAVRRGDLLPRWVPELAGGFGYPIFAVYGPLGYYVPTALTLAGLSVFASIKLDTALLCLASAAAAYHAVRTYAGRLASLAAAAAYASAPYTMVNAFVRADIAELATFPLTALTVAGLLRLDRRLAGDAKPRMVRLWPAVAAISVPLALIPAAHNLSLLTFAPTLLAVVALGVVRELRRRGSPALAARTFGLACVLGGLLAAWFLLPALEWQRWLRISTIPSDGHFYGKLLDVPGLLGGLGSIEPSGWFPRDGSWWFFSVAPGPQGELPAGPAYAATAVALAPAAPLLFRRSSRRGAIVALSLGACATAFLMTRWSTPLWQQADRLTLMQFPWRFVGPLTLDVALLAGLCLGALPRLLGRTLSVALILGSVAPALVVAQPAYQYFGIEGADPVLWPAQWRRELTGGIGTTGNGLFLPTYVAADVPGLPPPATGPFAAGASLDVRAIAFDGDSISLRYAAPAAQMLTLARLFAPPWHATLDGRAVPLAYQQGTGLQQVRAPAGEHVLTIRLVPTWSEIAGGALSLTALAALALGLAWRLAPWPSPRSVLALGSSAAALLALAALAVAMAARPPGPKPLLPPAQVSGGLLQIVGWRLDTNGVWGRMPTLVVAMWTTRPIRDDEDLVVRLTSTRGGQSGELRQRPRLGMFRTRGWPADLLVDDRLVLPGAANLCAGTYRVEVGVVRRGSQDEPAFQQLGDAAVSGDASAPCAPIRPSGSPDQPAFTVLGYRVDGNPAGAYTKVAGPRSLAIDVRVRALRPTPEDEAVTVQLVDPAGRVVGEQRSSIKDDLIASSLWRPSDTITYHADLSVPPDSLPGLYRLRAGLFSWGGNTFDIVQAQREDTPSRGPVDLGSVILLPPPAPVATPVATFGSQLALLDTAVNAGRFGEVRPGDRLGITTRWRALRAPDADYTLFVQLLDRDGRLVAQADGQPLHGQYPTGAWGSGETVVDDRELALPVGLAPGTYDLITGWYALASGRRLAVEPAQRDDAYRIGQVTINGP